MDKHYRSWVDVPVQEWKWGPHFRPEEFACRGSGELLVAPHALDCLVNLRRSIHKPIIISSAYRSPDHNRRVGGAKNSQHLRGVAFDILVANQNPRELYECAKTAGFTGFGFYPRNGFLHVDTGPDREWGKKGLFLMERAARSTLSQPGVDHLPSEAARVPEKLSEDGEFKGAVAAAASGVPIGVTLIDSVSGLAPMAQVGLVGAGCVFAVGIGFVLVQKLRS